MKINERAIKALEEFKLEGKELIKILPTLAEQMEMCNAEDIELIFGFDKDGTVPVGDLLPTVIIRLSEKTEKRNKKIGKNDG